MLGAMLFLILDGEKCGLMVQNKWIMNSWHSLFLFLVCNERTPIHENITQGAKIDKAKSGQKTARSGHTAQRIHIKANTTGERRLKECLSGWDNQTCISRYVSPPNLNPNRTILGVSLSSSSISLTSLKTVQNYDMANLLVSTF